MTTTTTSEQFIRATPAQIYYAFTHAASLTEWLCDYATVAPRPGGRMYLWWHGDFYSSGEYIELNENLSIKFKWFARFEPAASEVLVKLDAQDNGTRVTLLHAVPDGEDWLKRAAGFKEEWDTILCNLAQVLETGLDKRTFDRPMLGINISDYNPMIAASMGVPVSNGVRLDEVRTGLGAHAAGLQKDDVLVELNGQPLTNDNSTFIAALHGKKGGDRVPVTFYRGPEKKTVIMELTKRPVPDIPWDSAELSHRMRIKYDNALEKLEACFTNVSDDDAGKEPAPGEWSAKQTLAHLLQNERFWISNLDDVIGGYPRVADDWGGNQSAHINATVEAYGTARAMLDEMHRLAVEMVAFLRELPVTFIVRKADYILAASQLLELESHTISHIDQICAAIASARKA